MRHLRIAPAAGLAVVLLVSVLGAQTPQDSQPGAYEPHPEAQEAIGKLKSPFCPGLMLEVCPHPKSAELKDSIQALAASGLESDSIVEWMLAEYGEEWRAVPRAQGKGIWAWVMPPLALVAGLIIVALALRKFRGRSGTEPPEKRDLSPEEEARLSDALRELEEAESEDALL